MKHICPKLLFCFVTTISALLNSSPSNANCEQADMAGLWHIFFAGSSVMVNISTTGDITQGSYTSPLHSIDLFGGGNLYVGLLSGKTSAGHVEVLKNCRVAGRFRADEYPKLIHEYLSLDSSPTFEPIIFQIENSRTRPDGQYWFGLIEVTDYPFPDILVTDIGFTVPLSQGNFAAVKVLQY